MAAALNQAVKWGWLERSPASRVTLPDVASRRPQIPTSQEVQALIAACRTRSERLGMFVLVAAVTGCRRGEIAALRWADLVGDGLKIRASAFDVGDEHGVKATKTGKERVVIVDPLLRGALDAWHARCVEMASAFGVTLSPDSFIFSARPDGARPVNVHTVSSGLRLAADSIGLRHVHMHSLRHFAATELLGSGLNARDTADRLGHADPSVTLRTYTHATIERQRLAAVIGGRILEGLDGTSPADD